MRIVAARLARKHLKYLGENIWAARRWHLTAHMVAEKHLLIGEKKISAEVKMTSL